MLYLCFCFLSSQNHMYSSICKRTQRCNSVRGVIYWKLEKKNGRLNCASWGIRPELHGFVYLIKRAPSFCFNPQNKICYIDKFDPSTPFNGWRPSSDTSLHVPIKLIFERWRSDGFFSKMHYVFRFFFCCFSSSITAKKVSICIAPLALVWFARL